MKTQFSKGLALSVFCFSVRGGKRCPGRFCFSGDITGFSLKSCTFGLENRKSAEYGLSRGVTLHFGPDPCVAQGEPVYGTRTGLPLRYGAFNLSRIESGRTNLTVKTLCTICNALGVSLRDLLR